MIDAMIEKQTQDVQRFGGMEALPEPYREDDCLYFFLGLGEGLCNVPELRIQSLMSTRSASPSAALCARAVPPIRCRIITPICR